MSFWSFLRGRRRPPTPELGRKIDRYRALETPAGEGALDQARFVVVDVETSGLNPYRDRLIAIGGLVLDGGLLRLGGSFEVVLRQDRPSQPANILVHGIDGTTQITGADPADAILEFFEFAGKAPLIGYHADFDRVVLSRAARHFSGFEPENLWLDVARLAPALLKADLPAEADLDEWAAAFGIANPLRHNAVADALVTAQLFQVVLAAASSRGIVTLAELAGTERNQRGLERFGSRAH